MLLPRLLLITCILLCSLILGAAETRAYAESPSDPWAQVTANQSWQLDDTSGDTPQEGLEEWHAARDALQMGTHTLAWTIPSIEQTDRHIAALLDQGFGAWEEALFAECAAAGHISPQLASDWIGFLRRWPSLNAAQRIRIQLSLRLRLRGSGLGSVAPRCLPKDLAAAELLDTLAQIEDDIPGRRLRSRLEPPPAIPADAVRAALQRPDSSSIVAALALVALTSPNTPILARWTPNNALYEPGCALQSVRLFFPLVVDPSANGTKLFQALVGFSAAPVSSRWLWRFAVHRYLMGDADAVRTIDAYFARTYTRNADGIRFMHTLAAISDGGTQAPPGGWPGIREGSNPTYKWIAAEAARVRGQTASAADALAAVTDADAQCPAAWISLAAARNTLHRGHGVYRALEALKEVAPPLPIYNHWRTALQAHAIP